MYKFKNLTRGKKCFHFLTNTYKKKTILAALSAVVSPACAGSQSVRRFRLACGGWRSWRPPRGRAAPPAPAGWTRTCWTSPPTHIWHSECTEITRLSWWKNQTQYFTLLLWNFILILKIFPVTRFADPKAAFLTLKMLRGSRLWFCKIIPEAARDKLILAHFPCSQWEAGTRENRPIKEKRILWRFFNKMFKISK